MSEDHKGGIIGIMPNVYYLVKKKNPLNHISDLCDLSELQSVTHVSHFAWVGTTSVMIRSTGSL